MGLYKLTYRPQGQNENSTTYLVADGIPAAIERLTDLKKKELTSGQSVNVVSVSAVQEEFLG